MKEYHTPFWAMKLTEILTDIDTRLSSLEEHCFGEEKTLFNGKAKSEVELKGAPENLDPFTLRWLADAYDKAADRGYVEGPEAHHAAIIDRARCEAIKLRVLAKRSTELKRCKDTK